MEIEEPTSDQCEKRTILKEDCDSIEWATFYPQIGGYGGRAVIQANKQPGRNECFDVYIWHDGEFPFSGESDPGKKPVKMHHCMAQQFVRFGNEVIRMTKEKE